MKIRMKEGKPVKELKMNRIKEVGKKAVFDFVRSENGSVGTKNAATIGAFAGALTLSQSIGDAQTLWDENGCPIYIVSVAI